MKLSNKVSVRQYWLLGFFFFSVRCPPVSFPFTSAERERERLRNASRPPQAAGGAQQFPRQVEHAATVLSEIPGSWCPGTGGGEALALGAAAVARGPFKVLQQQPEVSL